LRLDAKAQFASRSVQPATEPRRRLGAFAVRASSLRIVFDSRRSCKQGHTMNISASGEFWLPETPHETVRGAFRADPGEQPEAVLDDALVEDPRVSRPDTGGLVYAQGAAGSVKASLPKTLQGRLEAGDCVTLVDASQARAGSNPAREDGRVQARRDPPGWCVHRRIDPHRRRAPHADLPRRCGERGLNTKDGFGVRRTPPDSGRHGWPCESGHAWATVFRRRSSPAPPLRQAPAAWSSR
jgi:hypothetical protein